MGQKPKSDEINFNYPIPRALHHRVRMFAAEHMMAIKDVVINALIFYLANIESIDQDSEEL